MRYRDAIIEEGKTLENSGTLVKDMDIVDPVSAIEFEFHATNDDANDDNFISDVITNIQIVDGSDVLCEVNLSELEALHFYKTGKTPVLFPSEWENGQQRHACLLLFGRRLWDTEYGIDFTRFRNPQLKITSNLAAITAVGSGGFESGTLRANIVAKVMEDMAVKPTKYLMDKEIISWTSATSGDKRIDLPKDYPYRMLMARLWVEGSHIAEIVTQLKLTCDTDKFILFDRNMHRIDEEAFMRFGRCFLKHDLFRHHNETVRVLCNREPDLQMQFADDIIGGVAIQRSAWCSQVNILMMEAFGTYEYDDRKVTCLESGHALHATLPIIFGEMDNPETWFDPKVYGKVEWVGTEAVEAACALIAEQERALP